MKKLIIGGLPSPIGGVTTYISRLAESNLVDIVLDLYPSKNKSVPEKFKGKVVYLKGIADLIFYFWITFYKWKGWLVHFNFSKPKALFLMLLLPKFKTQFVLMLHHGELKVNCYSFIYKLALYRFEYIFCLSSQQEEFYLAHGVCPTKLLRTSSYVKPVKPKLPNETTETVHAINNFFESENVLVCSGYPTELYNHFWCIDFVKNFPQYKLAIFLYGSGPLENDIKRAVSDSANIKIFESLDQSTFNFALSKAKAYLRPTSKDSFGIAVGDAASFGVKVLASDVCERYSGVNLFTPINYEVFKVSLLYLLNDQELPVQKKLNFREFNYNYFNGTK